MHGHVLLAGHQNARAVVLEGLGPKADACREPINVISTSSDPGIRLISNPAPTPFLLDAVEYGSVEAFWRRLKLPEDRREAVAGEYGQRARHIGDAAIEFERFSYRARLVVAGTPAHWSLMARAALAKFTQDEGARRALLDTGSRPLQHRTKRDSRRIPGVIMAEIWMRIRERLRDQTRSASRRLTRICGESGDRRRAYR